MTMTMRKLQVLLGVLLVCLSVTSGMGATGDAITVSSCAEAAAVDPSNPADDGAVANPESELACTAPSTDLPSLVLMPVDDLADRAAICRLIPECSTNADCDAQCDGAGLGRCAHSRCPVRVCRCR